MLALNEIFFHLSGLIFVNRVSHVPKNQEKNHIKNDDIFTAPAVISSDPRKYPAGAGRVPRSSWMGT
jgi:hypothetical protein